MRAGRGTGGGAAGSGRPGIGSAGGGGVGHLAFLACFLIWGGSTSPNLPGVAQVVLIDGTTNAVSAGEKDLTAPPADKPRRQGIRPATEGLPAAPSLAVIRDPSPEGPAPQSPGVVMRPGGEAPVPAPAGAAGRAHETSPRDAKDPGSGRMLAVLPSGGTAGGWSGGRER